MAEPSYGWEPLLFGGEALLFSNGPLLFRRDAGAADYDKSGLDGPRVALDALAFGRLLGNLLPTGDAWPEEADAVQSQALQALAAVFAGLHARANILVTEAAPASTAELLPEWEASVGLPDSCAPLAPTVAERRATVVAKLIAQGGASIPYLTAYAAALGSAVTITQFQAFRADASAADDPANADLWACAWQVNVPDHSAGFYFCADQASAGDALATFQTGALECRMRKIAPAQTALLFHYAA